MILFLYDDLDPEQGAYFSDCVLDAKDHLRGVYPQMSILEVSGASLNADFVDQRLLEYNHVGFLFAAYSHGNSRSLIARQIAYLQCDKNISLLKNAFIFTIACKAAIEFGLEAINLGARAFIGYKNDSFGILHEHFVQYSRRCDNYALLLFLQGYQVGQAVEKAKDHYTHTIAKFGWHPIVIPALTENRNNLVAYGELELTITALLGV